MTMNIKVNYISTIWWFLQTIILISSTSVLEFWIVEFFVCMVSLISVLTNSLKIKVVSYLFLVVYSIVISYIIGLLWLFFVYEFYDKRTFYLLIPLLNLYFSIKYYKFYLKSLKLIGYKSVFDFLIK